MLTPLAALLCRQRSCFRLRYPYRSPRDDPQQHNSLLAASLVYLCFEKLTDAGELEPFATHTRWSQWVSYHMILGSPSAVMSSHSHRASTLAASAELSEGASGQRSTT